MFKQSNGGILLKRLIMSKENKMEVFVSCIFFNLLQNTLESLILNFG